MVEFDLDIFFGILCLMLSFLNFLLYIHLKTTTNFVAGMICFISGVINLMG